LSKTTVIKLLPKILIIDAAEVVKNFIDIEPFIFISQVYTKILKRA
jgi:hypothetical protein